MKKISLCYITKNEEENIKSSILSCKEVVDEIVVVDTGSTDNTVKIAEELGARIDYFEWCNDFSKARNYAISCCTGDYILFLDADEYFSPALKAEDRDKIQEYLKAEADAYGFLQEDYDKITKKVHHTVHLVRMFVNNGTLEYRNQIHEAVARKDDGELVANILPDFKIIHTGYSSNISGDKARRNLEMLESVENKGALEYFYLARESYSLGKPEDCIKYADLFFADSRSEGLIKNSSLIYEIYFLVLKAKKALPDKYSDKDVFDWLKVIRDALPYIPKIYFYLGLYYYDNDFIKAREYFYETLLKEKEFKEGLYTYLDDFEGYKAEIYYYLAKIEFFEGKRQNAINKIGVACVFDNRNPKYLGLLLSFLNHTRTKEVVAKNIDFISNVYRPATKEDYVFLIRGLAATNLMEEFINYAIMAVQNFEIKTEDNCSDIYFAEMISTNNPDEVLEKIITNQTDRGNFIKLCCMIYKMATQGNLAQWESELNKLPETHQQVFRMLINLEKPEEITDNFKTMLRDTFLKMTFLGFASISINFLNILKEIYGYDKNMSTILNVWSSAFDPDIYEQIIDFMQGMEDEQIVDKDTYAKDYLYFLFMLKDYDRLIEVGYDLANRDFALPLNYIRAAEPSKKNIKLQREMCVGN